MRSSVITIIAVWVLVLIIIGNARVVARLLIMRFWLIVLGILARFRAIGFVRLRFVAYLLWLLTRLRAFVMQWLILRFVTIALWLLILW